MSDASEDIVRRSWEHYLGGDLAASRRLFADDFVAHVAGFPGALTIDQYGQQGEDWLVAFPDFRLDIQDFIVSGDRVVTRAVMSGKHAGPLLGIPATGRRIEISGILIDRVEEGLIVERWANWDLIAMMQQLGLMPSLAITETRAVQALMWLAVNGRAVLTVLLGAAIIGVLVRRFRQR
jgi:steroid delta-isomerase-like uncharacterized protein